MRELDRTRASLWQRCLAFGADYLVMGAYLALVVLVGLAVNQYLPSMARALFGDPVSGQAVGFLLVTTPITLYFSLMESSAWQATWGKRRVRIRVTARNGERLSPARALGRTALKFAPWELAHTFIWQISFAQNPESPLFTAGLVLVWLLVGANVASLLMSPDRQTLYDRLAGTVVVRNIAAA